MLREIYWAYRNKATNKLFGIARMPAHGKRKGDVLLSYMTSPFTNAPWEHPSDPHSSYWECHEIARLFSERGYGVDIIDWKDSRFVPKKRYTACIDIQKNLARLFPLLSPETKKVMHIVSSYADAQNQSERERLAYLKERRGIDISPTRSETDGVRNPAFADFLEGFGNKAVRDTYVEFGKPIFSIPISVASESDFPEQKNFERAKKSFLWFGGGGAVLKGLDLVLEAFSSLPDLHLYVIGPAASEKEFSKAYEKELSSPNVTVLPRPHIDRQGNISTAGRPLKEIMNSCGAAIFPSASEGASGSVIQAAHFGLIPIVTPRTGIDERMGAVLLPEATVESVRDAVLRFSELPSDEVRRMSARVYSFVRERHTKRSFSESYARFIDDILKL